MRQRVAAALAAVVVLSGLAVSSASAAPPPARASAARDRNWRPAPRLQVRFKEGVGAAARAAALAGAASRGLSVREVKRIPALNASVLAVSDVAAAQRLLRDDSRVAYAEPTSVYRPAADPAPTEPRSRELTEIGVAGVHDATTPNLGTGQVVAILDSPVSGTVADLDGAGKVVDAGDFTTPYAQPANDPWQDFACDAAACPHGTGVASAAAAESGDGNMVGVAPGATIRSYNVFRRWVYTDPDTSEQWHDVLGDSADIAAALAAVATYGATHPELVAANMSLSGVFDNQLLKDAIALVHTNAPQVTVVAASGNDGGERANFPAGDPYVLSVGATGQIPETSACSTVVAPSTPWTVTSFSNRGDVDVVAPGRCVDVWYPTIDENTNAPNPGTVAVRKEDGTSFAAPMVAGALALLGAQGVTGNAARAAVVYAATLGPHAPGKAHVATSLDVADGPNRYTAVFLDRGAYVASNVGRRDVEAIRVAPGSTAPAMPAPTVTAGFGTLASLGAATSSGVVTTQRFRFTAADANKAGQAFGITVWDGVGGSDDFTAQMRMLDAYDNYEGLPTPSGQTNTVQLDYGVRSAYVRSIAVPSGARIDMAFTFGEAVLDPAFPHPADLLIWEPSSNGGTADAAMEPIPWGIGTPGQRSGTEYLVAGGSQSDICAGVPDDPGTWRNCRPGRYLIGFLAYSPLADSSSTSKYSLRLTSSAAPTATVSAPAVASSASITGPFVVRWGGSRAVKWDVAYRTGPSTTWKPWKTKTTGTAAWFGTNSSPVKIAPGATYWFRVIAHDSLGNQTLPVTGYTSVPFDDRSSSIAYSGTWTSVSVSDRWMKTARKSSAAGARASMTTTTSLFRIVGDRCATCGKLKVYVDGVLKATVDTYRSSTAVRQVLWTSSALSYKSHRITIVVSGTGGRPKVVLDGIAIRR